MALEVETGGRRHHKFEHILEHFETILGDEVLRGESII
jgi:hypothetical protein